MTIQERLKAFIRFLNISEREFCRNIGVSPTYVQTLGSKIKRSTLNAMQRAYPLLNTQWLLNGSGEMLLSAPITVVEEEAPAKPPASPDPAPSNDLALRLLALVESQQKTLADNAVTLADNAATIKRLSEEVAAQRLQIAALTEEGIRDVAEGVSPSSFQAAPSAVNSLV